MQAQLSDQGRLVFPPAPNCELKRPPYLRPGDGVAVFAVAMPEDQCDSVTRAHTRDFLSRLGLEEVFEEVTVRTDRIERRDAQSGAAEFMQLYTNPRVRALFSFWGGWTTNKILPYLDYEFIAKHPKLLLGGSDTTALSAALYAKAGLSSVFGCGLVNFGCANPPAYTTEILQRLLFGHSTSVVMQSSSSYSDNDWWRTPTHKRAEKATPQWKSGCDGVASGRAFGASLDTLLALAGTEYFPNLREHVLLLEEGGVTSAGAFERNMFHLRALGTFDSIVGLAIGRFEPASSISDSEVRRILEECLEGKCLPTLYDIDFGHTQPTLLVPQGETVHIDSIRKQILIEARK